jgi:RNA-directed DNA polymerase
MHGTEQSDPLIVPRKPVNNAARAVAESAEGSGGTKRNAVLQTTHRTQRRESVSQAQDRIREAVNRNKKERLILRRSCNTSTSIASGGRSSV